MKTTEDLMRQALSKKPVTLDAVTNPGNLVGAVDYTEKDIALKAVAAIHQWAETDNLGEGETNADRLMALMIGIADADKNGEITGDEQDVIEIALNTAFDYLTSLGVDEEDAGMLLNDWDNDAADRIIDLVTSVLPDGEDSSMDAIDDFVFGEKDEEPVLDAVFRKKIAFRGGKKTLIKKRVSGNVRLSGAQKVAIKKMHMKSHSAGAMMKRAKSMRMRKKAGI